MLDASPLKYAELDLRIDTSVSEYLAMSDRELNEQGRVVDYYRLLFTYLRGALAEADGRGVTYFAPGCMFLRRVAPPDGGASFVGVQGTNNQHEETGAPRTSFVGDLFHVRGAGFLDAWEAAVLDAADARVAAELAGVVAAKREEYVRVETARRAAAKEEAREKGAEEAPEPPHRPPRSQAEDADAAPEEAADAARQEAAPEDEEGEVAPPDDFDEKIEASYRTYLTVELLKRKMDYIEPVAPLARGAEAAEGAGAYSRYYADEDLISPALFFRKSGQIGFGGLRLACEPKKAEAEADDAEPPAGPEAPGGEAEAEPEPEPEAEPEADPDDRTVLYRGRPVGVLRLQQREMTANAKHLEPPIHRIYALLTQTDPLNAHMIQLAGGNKIRLNRRYADDFCGYRDDRRFVSEMLDCVEARARAFVHATNLLYPCDTINGALQIHPDDDEAGVLLPYLSGRVRTRYHFRLSEGARAKYAEFNPRGFSLHTKCAERPQLLAARLRELDAEHPPPEGAPPPGGHRATGRGVLDKGRAEFLYDPPHGGGALTARAKGGDGAPETGGGDGGDGGDGAYRAHLEAMLGARYTRVSATSAGGACHQLAEALGCGSIPVVFAGGEPEPLLEGLAHPLEEGLHYLRVGVQTDLRGLPLALVAAEGLAERVGRLGVGMEERMREAGADYYRDHLTAEGYAAGLMREYFGY
jgi:hypothetical protein